MASFMQQLRESPATQGLLDSAGKFAAAQAKEVAPKLVERAVGGGTSAGGAAGGAVEGITKAADKGKGGVGRLFSGLGGAIKGLFKKGKGSSSKRPTNIVENLYVGAPVEEVFEKWTAYQEMAGYMKAIEAVDETKDDEKDNQDNQDKDQQSKDQPVTGEDADQQQDDSRRGEGQETTWKAKVWWSRRSWKATVVEQVENQRIKWKTDGSKGTVDGVVTFTPMGDNLTLVLVVIEYRSKGMFEWTANRWRTVGRRVRLDMKHFRRYVMMGELPPQDPEEQQRQELAEDTSPTEPQPDRELEPAAEPDDTEPDDSAESDDTESDVSAEPDDTESDDTEPDDTEPDEVPKPKKVGPKAPTPPRQPARVGE